MARRKETTIETHVPRSHGQQVPLRETRFSTPAKAQATFMLSFVE